MIKCLVFMRKIFISIKIIFFLGITFFLVSCGVTYPDNDSLKGHYPAFQNHYYFTNFVYQLDGTSSPVIKSNGNSDSNTLFFFIDQRDDIYYPIGFDVDFKKYDTRWFLQIDNTNSTNYFFYSNTAFGDNVSFHYYELGGNLLEFTNGYLLISNVDNLSWYVEAQLGGGNTNYSTEAQHRLSKYNSSSQSVTFIE